MEIMTWIEMFVVLARFGEWYRVELRSTTKLDPDFCKRFTEQVVKIYNVELCNTSNFSVFPKKVTREQPKIVVIFKKPMDEGDEIRIDFSCGRKTEGLTSLKMENPYTAIIRVPGLCSINIILTIYYDGIILVVSVALNLLSGICVFVCG